MLIILVSALILLANGSYSTTDWPERCMTWLKSSNTSQHKLQLCASRENELMCGNFTWHFDDHHCSMRAGRTDSSEMRCNQKFYQAWNDYPTCKCSSKSVTSEAISSKTYATASIMTPTYYNDASSTQLSKSGKILAVLVAVLVVLLVLVISGWVCTCWMVKNLRKQIKSSQTSNILMSALSTNSTTAYAGYENTPLGDTICHRATFQPSTEYSLLQSTTKPNSEMNVTGEDALYSDANEPKYHKLDRDNERSKIKTRAPLPQQKGGPENYSVLTYD